MDIKGIGRRKKYIQTLIVMIICFVIASCIILLAPKFSPYLMLITSFIFIILSMRHLRRYSKSKKWNVTEALIIKCTEDYIITPMTAFRDIKKYYPIIEYEYNYKGIKYRGSKVSHELSNVCVDEFNNWGDIATNEDKLWSKWLPNTMINIYVNPDNAEESVIVNSLSKERRSHHLSIFFVGIIILVFWVVLVIS